MALGTANIVGSMFQTIPAMAGFGMSGINSAAGAKSQMSLLMSGFIVGILMVALKQVIYFLPSAVLSSVIIMSVSKLVDIAGAKSLWRHDKSDLAVRQFHYMLVLAFEISDSTLSLVEAFIDWLNFVTQGCAVFRLL